MFIDKQARRDAKQLFRSCQANGSLDEARVRQVVHVLIAAGYRESPAILSHFLRLVRIELTQRTATIESAKTMTDDTRGAIQASLTQRYGPGLRIAFADRPSLIGGMRIHVGSDVYDGSVLGRLAALEKSF
jgi:F-type H+-transporting ATPase subunit delta